MPKWIHSEHTEKMTAMADELSSIVKVAISMGGAGALPTPQYVGGAKNFMHDSLTRGWKSGGNFGKAMTGLGVGLSLPGAMEEQDPSGQGKSRPERLAEVGGATVGGMVGTGAASNLGNAITRKLDPTDRYLTNATHVMENKNFAPMTNAVGDVRNIAGKAMDNGNVQRLAERGLEKQVAANAGKFQMGNIGRWAKYKLPRAGLLAIPGALSVAGGMLGMGLGEKVMGLPFRGLRQQPQAPVQDPAANNDPNVQAAY